jgi:hypothetical protein
MWSLLTAPLLFSLFQSTNLQGHLLEVSFGKWMLDMKQETLMALLPFGHDVLKVCKINNDYYYNQVGSAT